MSKPQRTQQTVQKNRHNRYEVVNKHPDYDYSFRSSKELEGGNDGYGYEIVTGEEGECWATPVGAGKKRTGTKKNGPMYLHDTVLCRRPKAVSKEFKIEEDEKYNAQMRMVKENAKNARINFRQIADGHEVNVKDEGESNFNTTERKTE